MTTAASARFFPAVKRDSRRTSACIAEAAAPDAAAADDDDAAEEGLGERKPGLRGLASTANMDCAADGNALSVTGSAPGVYVAHSQQPRFQQLSAGDSFSSRQVGQKATGISMGVYSSSSSSAPWMRSRLSAKLGRFATPICFSMRSLARTRYCAIISWRMRRVASMRARPSVYGALPFICVPYGSAQARASTNALARGALAAFWACATRCRAAPHRRRRWRRRRRAFASPPCGA